MYSFSCSSTLILNVKDRKIQLGNFEITKGTQLSILDVLKRNYKILLTELVSGVVDISTTFLPFLYLGEKHAHCHILMANHVASYF